MINKAITIGVCIALGILLAACITSVDDGLPYAQLPEITVATPFNLVASPSHPTAYLSTDQIPVGEKVQVIGTDQNAAWLLVLHNNLLGWMPTFYSRDNVGTLQPAIVFAPLSDKCTQYLGATFAPDQSWVSTTSGSAIVFGSIFRPGVKDQFADAALEIEITGAGQASEADYVHTPLTGSSSLILFGFSLAELQPGDTITFRLNNPGNEPVAFEAAFFSDSCAQTVKFTQRLPIGKPKVKVARPAETPQVEQERSAGERPTAETTPIVHLSDARTPMPTPVPTLDKKVYGETIEINEASASSVHFTNNYPVSNTIDEDIHSEWVSNTNDDIGAWLELRLYEPITITGLRIYTPGLKGGLGQRLKDLSLIFSDNSQQTIRLDNTEGWQYKPLAPVTTQSMRLVVDSVHNVSVFKTIELYEIQLFGKLQVPQVIQTNNPAVSIQLHSGFFAENSQSLGRLKANFLLFDSPISEDETINVIGLDRDVAGDWIRLDAVIQNHHPDEDGFYVVNLPPQHYLLTRAISATSRQPIVPGWYSDQGLEEGEEAPRGIIFPIEAGKITEIEVQFSRLVVGVLNEAGKAVRGTDHADWAVVVCADAIADEVDEAARCARIAIDPRGAATFHLTPGAYQIRVLKPDACYWEFPVTIALKEAKEELVTIHSETPDACPKSGQP